MLQNDLTPQEHTILSNPLTLTKEVQKLIFPKNSETDDNPELSYVEYISFQIDLMQRDLHNCLQTQLNDLESFYSKFKNSIKDFIERKMNMIHQGLNVNENNIHIQKYAMANIHNPLKNMFDVHNKIILTLKENLKILNEFLDAEQYLQKNKPTEEYLIKNLGKIYSNWLFSKIDFAQYKLNAFYTPERLDKQVISYINVHPEDKFSCFKLVKDNVTNKSTENNDMKLSIGNTNNNLLLKNKNILRKLHIVHLKELPPQLLEASPMEKVTKLELNHCPLKIISNIPNIFPSLNHFSLQNSSPDLIELDIFNTFKLKLQQISFTKMDLITNSFNKIMTSLVNIEEIRNNLTHLSFADNFISEVDFNQFLFQSNKLHKLQELNFEKNHIYKFALNSSLIPNLKVINMSTNAFSKSYFSQFKKEKTLLLLGNNNYLTHKVNNEQYYDFLKYQLENFDYGLEYLTLNGLFCKETCHRLPEIRIHKSIQISVKKLDLSNCSLDDETVIKFFKTNPGFFDLRYLKLNDNYLTDDFFQLFIDNKLHLNFPKLKTILFTSNEISGDNFKVIHEFILKNTALARLVLLKNPLSKKIKIPNKKDKKILPKDNVIVNEKKEKLNDFALILKDVEEMNKAERAEKRNYLNIAKNDKGLVIRFDAGDKYAISNYSIKYSDVEFIRNKSRYTTC
jgi:hypothetical protein